jgi:hypothetical protein
MKYDKIVLAGGNGYLGKVLQDYYKPLAREVIVLSRKAAPPFENIFTYPEAEHAVNDIVWQP